MDALLDRFCRYVQVDTTAVEDADCYPSSQGQLVLGRMLGDELQALHLNDVEITADGIVLGTIPATVEGAPTIAWFAHLDTSPEASGENVKPIVHRDYDGKDIVLPGDARRVIRVCETDGLGALKGRTLVTSDGTTLLGADDKAGIAIIMTAAERLVSQRDIPHGPVRVVFTCDEEIGRGTDKINLAKVGAIVGYTIDGEAEGMIENETFSADLAVVSIKGKNIHPAMAKGKMVNAIRAAGVLLARLPRDTLAPEATGEREGFVHPYVINGGVAETTIRVLLRSFVTEELREQESMLRTAAREVESQLPGLAIDVHVRRQYRNMMEFLAKEPRAVDLAAQAMRNIGVAPTFHSVRGGTDGSRLSEMGLPTPNLSAGMHNFHSPLEFACLEQMQTTVGVLVELARLWGAQRR